MEILAIWVHHASALLWPVAPVKPLFPGAAPCAATQSADTQLLDDFAACHAITSLSLALSLCLSLSLSTSNVRHQINCFSASLCMWLIDAYSPYALFIFTVLEAF